MRRYAWAAWAAFAVVAAALAVSTALRPFVAPLTLQERVMAIAADVRCPECAGESAADSDTAASIAIRAEIARDVQAGLSTQQILGQLAGQYGEWILYKPPVRGAFLLLWATPVAGLAAAALVLGAVLRAAARRGSRAAAASQPAAGPDGPAPPAPGPAGAVDADLLRRLQRRL